MGRGEMNIVKCPECEADVVACDNNVYLDYPAVDWDGRHAGWTTMNLGGMQVASNGGPGFGGKAHTLHEHQPAESVMAR